MGLMGLMGLMGWLNEADDVGATGGDGTGEDESYGVWEGCQWHADSPARAERRIRAINR